LDKPARGLFTPVKQGTLAQLVVSQIKNLIFSKGIDVGQKLPPERDLAEQLNISRSAVCEAFRSLEHAGFIEIRIGRTAGAYVVDQLYKPFYHSTIDLLKSGKIEIQQFLEARTAIECFAIKLAVKRVKEQDLKRLEEINQEFVKASEGVSRLLENNSRFHVALAELSGNHLLTMMLQSLMKLMEDMGFNSSEPFTSRRVAHASHAAIVEALRLKDLRLCEERLASNIALSKELRLRSVSARVNAQKAKRPSFQKRSARSGKKKK
jgi:GntR family transcriptional repressor for pyruvate dehydrogenase complex